MAEERARDAEVVRITGGEDDDPARCPARRHWRQRLVDLGADLHALGGYVREEVEEALAAGQHLRFLDDGDCSRRQALGAIVADTDDVDDLALAGHTRARPRTTPSASVRTVSTENAPSTYPRQFTETFSATRSKKPRTP